MQVLFFLFFFFTLEVLNSYIFHYLKRTGLRTEILAWKYIIVDRIIYNCEVTLLFVSKPIHKLPHTVYYLNIFLQNSF